MVRKKACNSEQGKDLNTETLFFYMLLFLLDQNIKQLGIIIVT